jgi:uncharacterized damage-inducible protein DinB
MVSEAQSLAEMWRIHARINLYLLDHVDEAALADRLNPRGWSVGQSFAHLHNTRLTWLDGYADLREGLEKLDRRGSEDKALLREALAASGKALGGMIEQAAAAGRVKGYKPHPAAFVGYMIAHESYHHGEIGLMLGQSGHRLSREVAFGMWQWHNFVD